jgi:glycosyltransferase involved in cell wall biosynthesis
LVLKQSNPKKIHLALDARMVEHSGIGTCIKNLMPRLSVQPELEITVLGDKEKLAKFSWFNPDRFIPLKSPIYGLAEQIELSRQVPVCDVFWSPHYNIPVGPIRARKRLVTICDVFHLAYFQTLSLPQKVYAKLILKAAVTLSQKIVTISEFSRAEIVKHLNVSPEKLEMIYCGTDRGFNQGADDWAPEGRYLLVVGNVKPHKNLKGALAGFLKIAPFHPDLKLIIVGRKEGFITGDNEVAAMVAGEFRDRVEFTGYVSDGKLKAYYKHATAILFPSFYEGFGLPILEGMSFGIPVLSSERASMKEVGGEALLYFDPGNTDSIVAAIDEVLAGRWMPDAARYAQRLQIFDWDESARQYISIIQDLAFENGAGA